MNMNDNLVKLARDSKVKITLEYYPDEDVEITVGKNDVEESCIISNKKSFYTDSFIIYGVRNLLDSLNEREDEIRLQADHSRFI